MTHAAEAERLRCAARTREEMADVSFRRVRTERDVLRFSWQATRCKRCGACPLMLRALTVMLPAEPEPQSAEMFKLAS